MKNPKNQTVKITRNKGNGTVWPTAVRLSKGQSATFTITGGTAVVFVPDTEYIDDHGTVNGQRVKIRIPGNGILIRVGPGGSTLSRNYVDLPNGQRKRYPIGIHIDGARGFAKGSTPVMILDPP